MHIDSCKTIYLYWLVFHAVIYLVTADCEQKIHNIAVVCPFIWCHDILFGAGFTLSRIPFVNMSMFTKYNSEFVFETDIVSSWHQSPIRSMHDFDVLLGMKELPFDAVMLVDWYPHHMHSLVSRVLGHSAVKKLVLTVHEPTIVANEIPGFWQQDASVTGANSTTQQLRDLHMYDERVEFAAIAPHVAHYTTTLLGRYRVFKPVSWFVPLFPIQLDDGCYAIDNCTSAYLRVPDGDHFILQGKRRDWDAVFQGIRTNKLLEKPGFKLTIVGKAFPAIPSDLLAVINTVENATFQV
jgi:hypothetical protein